MELLDPLSPIGSQTEIIQIEPKVDLEPIYVSLKHWHTGAQCLSEWRQGELEKLRKLIDKIQKLTTVQIKTDPALYWKQHGTGKPQPGFNRPASLSKDIPLCELRVSGKARVHGALLDDIFYLVWLDRNHGAFP